MYESIQEDIALCDVSGVVFQEVHDLQIDTLWCLENRQELPAKERRKEMFYLTTHSTHFIYGYMASDIW